MRPGIASRLAGSLMAAASADIRRHEASLRAHRASMVQPNHHRSPKRVKGRAGSAADRFAAQMGARTQEELDARVQKQQNWWLQETEELLWEE